MTGTSNINIIVGQGTAIKEIHNVKKQNLEINQQYVAQKAEDDKKEQQKHCEKQQWCAPDGYPECRYINDCPLDKPFEKEQP